MIKRTLENTLKNRLFKGKAIILLGPRQVGKTTLMHKILQELGNNVLYLNGDEADIRELLTNTTTTHLATLIGDHTIVFIDEAQRIHEIGLTLKLIVDNLKNVQVLVTGSSALELTGRINEPLTGRKYEYRLFPISFQEMVDHHGMINEQRLLEHRLIMGYYPEIVSKQGEEIELLKLLADSYLYKDLLTLESIKKPVLLEKILKALAYQVGNEVSFREIGELVGTNHETIEKYINLLQKAFVIFSLNAFSRNVRNEIKKGKKIYFYDNGILNAVKGNFNMLTNRSDKGVLFENFLLSERMKYLAYTGSNAKSYFWRTTQQQEIDYLEEEGGKLTAWEFKWKRRQSYRFPKTYTKNYPQSRTELITQKNFMSFVQY